MTRNIFILMTVLFFSGCAIKDKQNVKLDLKLNPETKSVIKGNVVRNKKSTKEIYLVLYKHIKDDKLDFKNYKLIDFSTHSYSNTSFKFDVPKGRYFLYACQNLEILRDKKYAYEFFSEMIEIDKSKEHNLSIQLSSQESIVKDSNILISTKNDISIFEKFNNLVSTNINDKIFKRENASLGLWSPLEFFQIVGGGLYLLGDYSMDKEIILFVHGMNGTPLDFKTIIDSLDKEKYLPIVYFYPTGMNLNYAVDGLKYSFDKFKALYPIKNIAIIAHSMGGLVSRSFINNYSDKLKIEKYITIATPWNGQKYAELGGDFAKRMAASFGNMVSKSAFIENNQIIQFPKYLKHYLLFGYKGRASLFLDNSNDGVISLSSQLYDKAERKAFMIYGFNDTHTSILKSTKPVNLIKDILSR